MCLCVERVAHRNEGSEGRQGHDERSAGPGERAERREVGILT